MPRPALALITGALLSAAVAVVPASSAWAGGTQTPPTSMLPLPTTTTTTVAGATTSTSSTTSSTVARSTTSTTRAPGVPPVPVAGPPTTVAKPGTKPAPPPDPTPILVQVQAELDQISAIGDYKPAQLAVASTSAAVTSAGAALLAARHEVAAAVAAREAATGVQDHADYRLRSLAIAAYTGVGYSAPTVGGQAGSQTLGGLSEAESADAAELLQVLGQKALQTDRQAHHAVADATRSLARAQAVYRAAEGRVEQAEATLLAAQSNLKIVTTAAVTPGAAYASSLPDLTAIEHPGVPTGAPATSSTSSTTTTTLALGTPLQPAIQGGVLYNGPPPTSPTILGKPLLDAEQLAAWFATTGRTANATVPIEQLAKSYDYWGNRLGVRDDIAFAQSVVETGFFSFPAGGQLTGHDNNFAGIGACDTCAHGWTFPSADTGVQAQLELLHEYATPKPWDRTVPNVIGGTGIGGCCSTWMDLAGRWASSTVYGISIMTIYSQMLSWYIPQLLLTSGLVTASAPAARGPELAPLPGTPPPTPKAKQTKPGPTTTTTVPSVAAAGRKSG